MIDLPGDKEWSEEDFFNFCVANPELNLERDKDGNVLIMSPIFLKSGMFESRVMIALGNWNEQTGLGYTFSSQSGFTLPNKAVRSPDASWIIRQRIDELPEGELDRFGRICPDFVVEIRSKADRLQALQEKMQEYLDNGCRLGFLIDPYEMKAWIYRPGKDAELITDFTASLSGEDVLPGFELSLTMFD